jgi:hypothetical protein
LIYYSRQGLGVTGRGGTQQKNYADLLNKPLFTDRWRANQQSGANYAGFTDQNQFFYRVGPRNPRLYLFAQAFFLLLKRRAS